MFSSSSLVTNASLPSLLRLSTSSSSIPALCACSRQPATLGLGGSLKVWICPGLTKAQATSAVVIPSGAPCQIREKKSEGRKLRFVTVNKCCPFYWDEVHRAYIPTLSSHPSISVHHVVFHLRISQPSCLFLGSANSNFEFAGVDALDAQIG